MGSPQWGRTNLFFVKKLIFDIFHKFSVKNIRCTLSVLPMCFNFASGHCYKCWQYLIDRCRTFPLKKKWETIACFKSMDLPHQTLQCWILQETFNKLSSVQLDFFLLQTIGRWISFIGCPVETYQWSTLFRRLSIDQILTTEYWYLSACFTVQ